MGTLDNRDQLIASLRQQLAEARAEVERLTTKKDRLLKLVDKLFNRWRWAKEESEVKLAAQAAELERLREAAKKVVESQGLGELADVIGELRKETEA